MISGLSNDLINLCQKENSSVGSVKTITRRMINGFVLPLLTKWAKESSKVMR